MTSVGIILEMESDLIANITRLLAQDISSGSAEWQARKLSELGTLRAMNKQALAKSLPDAMKAAKEEILQRGIETANGIDALVTPEQLAQALSPEASPALRQVWKTWETKTMQQLSTLGMTLINSAERQYIETVQKSTAKTLSGQITLREAIAESAATWAAQGLPALKDAANRTWSTEAYSQVVIRSNLRQVTTQTTLTRCEEVDQDLVEVSSHIGARPGCEPYQGKAFSLSGDKQSTGYDNLYNDTTYGEPSGLFGCNCGHQMYPYYPGTPKTFSPYSEKENENAYENSQEQRNIERSIRQAKRELSSAESFKDNVLIDEAKQKVSDRQADMRKFIDETNRTRRRDREQIY